MWKMGLFVGRELELKNLSTLLQTKYGCIYPCEVKFYNSEISKAIAVEFEQKLDRLSIPKRTSIRPVLIHCNGVFDSVIEMELFDYIIDFSELLKDQPAPWKILR